MRYLGGKHRLAKKIVAAIAENTEYRETVYEPFVGGGSVTPHLSQVFETVHIGDTHPDLIMMWSALYMGWEPPSEVSEEQYAQLRHEPPSALRGFVGFASSFGGKWFGGFARGDSRNFTAETARNVNKIVSNSTVGQILNQSYTQWTPLSGEVVYCDPPYRNTTGYSSTEGFDHEEFYRTVESWAASGVDVFVSEYVAPEHWEVVMESSHRQSVSRTSKTPTVERLYKVVP